MNETLSLSWDTHQSNICSGLSQLQQRGEFVDMTLAADGHYLKVHQMVMSLVSPYIKELISSAQCPHPVIFLNNISQATLCSLLEYIYTGEVNVHKENLQDLLAAARALHIKGLQEVPNNSLGSHETQAPSNPKRSSMRDILQTRNESKKLNVRTPPDPLTCMVSIPSDDNSDNHNYHDDMQIDNDAEKSNSFVAVEDMFDKIIDTNEDKSQVKKQQEIDSQVGAAQYSISIQGNLQAVINRYIYNLRYVQKSLNRSWRCVDYGDIRKCRAVVFTNDKNEVIRRKLNHNHPFHDDKILKKVRAGAIFTAFTEAENIAKGKKRCS